MDKEQYYKILDQHAEEWDISCFQYTNCSGGTPKHGGPAQTERPNPIKGYPVIIKWKDVVKQCELCNDRVVNQTFTITIKEDKIVKKCETCGFKQTEEKRLKIT